MKLALPSLVAVPVLLIVASAARSQPATGTGADAMTLDHFVDRQTARLMAANTDGDGRISRAEMAAMAARRGHDASRRFDAMDANHDGYLDRTEIGAALNGRFRSMDRNGDGILTPDERMSAGRWHERDATPDPAASPQP